MPDRHTNRDKSGFPADVLIEIGRSEGQSVRQQLERQLRHAIQEGLIVEGTWLPPTRTLAAELAVARTAVVEAYSQLVAEGYLEARQGSGTRVRQHPDRRPSEPARAQDDVPVDAEFAGGLPDPALFPRREWERHYRAVLADVTDAALRYPDAHGAPQLRDSLAGYLGRVRGVVTSPETMLITSGFTQALVLVCRVLRNRGVQRVAVEDPCFGFHRRAVAKTGVTPVPVRVDRDGIDVSRLASQDVGGVLVAPAHSYPTGAVLSTERRIQLVSWARDQDVVIIEDDYDAEFRYDRAPLGAVQGLAPQHVIYGGGVSKTLTPALRLGWLAAPAHLVGELAREKFYDDMGCGLLDQLTLARLYERGAFARHLRRARPLYRRRRDALLKALATHLPDARPMGVAAGLHLFVELPQGSNEAAFIDAARQRGVRVEAASFHWSTAERRVPAIVLGYGAVTEERIHLGIRALADAYRETC